MQEHKRTNTSDCNLGNIATQEVSQKKIMARTMSVDAKTGKLDDYSTRGILVEKGKAPVSLRGKSRSDSN